MAVSPTEAHIADLHALAAGEGIEGYRKLGRNQLAEELESRLGSSELEAKLAALAEAEASAAPTRVPPATSSRTASAGSVERRPKRQGAPDSGRKSEVKTPEPAASGTDASEEEVAGLVHLRGQGSRPFGFVYPGGFGRTDEAAYVGDALVSEFGLRTADFLRGTVTAEEDGRRVVSGVEAVNGLDPAVNRRRPDFDTALAIAPQLRDMIAPSRRDVIGRAIDLLAPLARGQRTIVVGADVSGRSEMLRALGSSLLASLRVRIVVAGVSGDYTRDEFWQVLADGSPAECFAEPGVDLARRYALLALAVERAKRVAEGRQDVVLIVDGAEELRDGLDSATGDEKATVATLDTLSKVLPGGGALTVVDSAVAVPEGFIESIVAVSDARPEPAVEPLGSRLGGEVYLREPGDFARSSNLHEQLAALAPEEATGWLISRIESTSSNYQLLSQL